MPDSNHVAWSGFCRSLAALGERRVVLLEGDRSRALDWLAGLKASLRPEAVLWVGSREQSPLATAQVAEPRKATRWLGRELDWVIWDGFAGNPPDGLAALAGTLKAGGLFFWLMPPLEQWSGFEDPDYARTGLETAGTHPFAARMAEILEAHPGVIRLHSDSMSLPPSLPEVATPFRVGATADQQALIERLVRLGQGHRKRPLVITADRGRGKSAALGIAAVRLLRAGRQRVLVTAPSAGAVTSVFRHAWREAYGTEPAEPANRLVLEDGAELVFLDIRDLLAQQPAAELVMVDEAAALPAPLLKQVLQGWPRVAFASTVHGYEGSGRGFDIRFRAVLDAETPKWQATTLEQPMRWAADDPLEQLASRLFLLDAEAPRSSLPGWCESGAGSPGYSGRPGKAGWIPPWRRILLWASGASGGTCWPSRWRATAASRRRLRNNSCALCAWRCRRSCAGRGWEGNWWRPLADGRRIRGWMLWAPVLEAARPWRDSGKGVGCSLCGQGCSGRPALESIPCSTSKDSANPARY